MAEQGLKRRTAVGMVWAYGSYTGGRLLVLVATAILARILTPKEFGLVALALTFIAFMDMLKDFGVAEALIIVDEDEVDEKAETAFVVMQVGGLLIFGLTAILGPIVADFYDEPALKGIMPALGFTFVLRSLGSAHYALSQKRLDFRTRTAAEMADIVVRGVVGIVLALNGAGAWSLVIGYIAGTTAMTVTLWAMVPWRPHFKPQRAHLRELLGFGGALTGVGLAGAILGNVDGLIIGKALGASALGLYSLASRLPELLIINLSVVAGQVLFPAFAAVEPEQLPRAFLTSMRYAAMIALPLAAFLGVLAEPLIVAAFGDQWQEAAVVMQLFCLYALVSPVTLVCGTILKARGRAALLLRLSLFQVVLVVPSVIIAVDSGINAVAAVHAAAAFVILVLQLVLAMRMLPVTFRSVLGALWPPVAAGLAMAGTLVVVDRFVDGTWPVLLVGAAAGTPVYAGVLWLLARDAMRSLLISVRPTPAPTAP